MRNKINNDIYKMYEEEFYKVEKLNKIINNQKIEISSLKYELNYLNKNIEKRIILETSKITKSLEEENNKLKEELNNALKESCVKHND